MSWRITSKTSERANERTSERANERTSENERASERTNEIKLRKSELANKRIINKKTLTDKTRIRKQTKESDYTINKTNRAYFNSLSSSVKLVATSLKFPSPRLLKADTIISYSVYFCRLFKVTFKVLLQVMLLPHFAVALRRGLKNTW